MGLVINVAYDGVTKTPAINRILEKNGSVCGSIGVKIAVVVNAVVSRILDNEYLHLTIQVEVGNGHLPVLRESAWRRSGFVFCD